MTTVSGEKTLTKADKLKWIDNQIEFFKPYIAVVASLYFPSVINTLSQSDHIVSMQDFVPSPLVVTATFLYLTNALYDLVRKWVSFNVYRS